MSESEIKKINKAVEKDKSLLYLTPKNMAEKMGVSVDVVAEVMPALRKLNGYVPVKKRLAAVKNWDRPFQEIAEEVVCSTTSAYSYYRLEVKGEKPGSVYNKYTDEEIMGLFGGKDVDWTDSIDSIAEQTGQRPYYVRRYVKLTMGRKPYKRDMSKRKEKAQSIDWTKTFDEVGKELSVSRQRVKQIYDYAVKNGWVDTRDARKKSGGKKKSGTK